MKDYNIKASRVKSLIRRWRAKGVTPGDTMKLMMLYLGIDRFLSHELMVYPKTEFNKMRKDLGFKTITAMLDVIRQSESFIIVHHRSDDGVVAIVSPAFKYNLEYTNDLYVEVAGEDEAETGVANSDETVGKCDKIVGECDTVYLNNVSEDTYKDVSINTSLDKDKEINNDRDIQLCQGHDEEMPLPKLDDKLFNKVALPKAKEAVEEYFYYLGYDHARMNDIFEYIIDELYERCNEDKLLMANMIDKYLEDRIEPIFARRKGIEHWKEYQIDAWLKSRHQQKLAHVKCDEIWNYWQLQSKKKNKV